MTQPSSTSKTKASDNLGSYDVAASLFQQVWNRAEAPIVAGQTSRSWLWGPGPFTAFAESYKEGVNGLRVVMYFDKARMEFTNPNSKYVSNGLLVVEMLSGKLQLGGNTFGKPGWYEGVKEGPADVNIVGDPGNWLTYAFLSPYASLNLDNRLTARSMFMAAAMARFCKWLFANPR